MQGNLDARQAADGDAVDSDIIMDEKNKPAVSVLMPAYNAAKYLRPAVDSISGQTFSVFEFIIIDDGSSDATAAIIDSYKYPRIRFFQQRNQGLAATLNRAVELSKETLLARQDQPERSTRL